MLFRQYPLNIKDSKILKDILQWQYVRDTVYYTMSSKEVDLYSQKVHRACIEIMLIPTEYKTKKK